MGKYDKIVDAKVTKTGQYFKAGRYRVQILAMKDVDSQKGKNFTVIETRVLASDNPEVPVGAERSQVIDMGNVMGFPNLKAFMAAVSGVDGTQPNVNEEVEAYWQKQHPQKAYLAFPKIVESVIEDNLLEDVEMDLECVDIKTQEGGDFTKHIWGVRDVSEDGATAA
jgi:hypothetical protein